MARISIYVPDDLKERMDAVGDMNWSQAAARAFQVELAEIAKQSEVTNINATIERLRASKLEHESAVAKSGVAAGTHWAETRAEYPNLVRAAESDPEQLRDVNEYSAYTAAQAAAFMLLGTPECDRDRQQANYFWDDIGIELSEANDPEWLVSFFQGAARVYEKVADEL